MIMDKITYHATRGNHGHFVVRKEDETGRHISVERQVSLPHVLSRIADNAGGTITDHVHKITVIFDVVEDVNIPDIIVENGVQYRRIK